MPADALSPAPPTGTPPVAAPAAPPAALDAIRAALGGRYGIERELGRGGMGAVYLARDLRLDRPVALKVLPAEFASQVALRDRFLRETRTAASFSHPNIVPVYAVEDSESLLAYAMGFVEGETVAERVRRAGPLPVRELVRLLQDVGYALAYAHGRGVVHRDIKPDNVMIERATGRALVMDFGISRSMAAPAVGGTRALTRVGEVVGTPEYMSPEQASGDVVDGRSDLYSLGLTAHFAATGRVAMSGDTTQKILVRQLTETVPPVAESRPDLPPALAEAIDRCVAKEPSDRFPAAEALVEAIDAAQLAEPEIPLPVRLFAGEAGTLSMVAFGMLIFAALFVRSSARANMSTLDIVIPLVGLSAILITRVLTSLAEARRLATDGFDADEVMRGLGRVVAERQERRDQLKADPEVRRRRKRTITRGAVFLGVGYFMIVMALRARTKIDDTHYQIGRVATTVVCTGIALLGTSLVLLLKSPFRMGPGERLFRVVWLGFPGRAFVRFAGRGVRRSGPPLRRGSGVRPAPVSPMPLPRPAAPVAPMAPVASPAPADRVGTLEARVAELERWRRDGR